MSLWHHLWDYLVLGDLARATRDILAEALRWPDTRLQSRQQRALVNTLTHLGDVREGFAVSLRTSDVESMDEMRQLVTQVLFDWESIRKALGVDLAPQQEVHLVRMQLMAFAHSYLTMALMPRLPHHQVTFPHNRPTYADIPVPRRPAQLLERIEELERVISDVEMEPVGRIPHDPMRRTYGFFETSAWLVAYHVRLFGGRAPGL